MRLIFVQIRIPIDRIGLADIIVEATQTRRKVGRFPRHRRRLTRLDVRIRLVAQLGELLKRRVFGHFFLNRGNELLPRKLQQTNRLLQLLRHA